MEIDFRNLKALLAKGELEKVLSHLTVNLSKTGRHTDEIILLSSRFNDTEESNRKGILDPSEYQIARNKIVDNLLSALRKIEYNLTVSVNEKLKYGELEKLRNRKRWIDQIEDGELKELVKELLEKEKQKQQIKEKDLRKEFEEEIKVLSKGVSKEFYRLKEIFSDLESISKLPDSTFIGIDFGTSNTVVSYVCYYKDRKDFNLTLPQPIELPFYKPKAIEEYIIPSKIFFDEEQSELNFGIDAKRNQPSQHIEGKNYWSSFKTQLGINHGNVFYDSLLKKNHDVATILNPDQATEIFLKWLLEQVQKYIINNQLPENIYYTVSIPASFNSNKREAYLKILERIGIAINGTILIDEPNAAFLHCLISLPKEKVKALQRSHIMVFDFGAGTCDISIVEFWEDSKGFIHSKNYSTSSDNLLGGDNIDLKIAEEVLLDVFLQDVGLDEVYLTPQQTQSFVSSLKDVAELLKISASKRLKRKPNLKGTESTVSVTEKIIVDFKGKKYWVDESEMSFAEFETVISQFLDEDADTNIFVPINAALDNAKMLSQDIDYIIMIGGSCKNPYIKDALSDFFNSAEVLMPDNLQTHVSKGTALNTALIYGQGKNIMDPVVSETISFELHDGSLVPLIEAGTPVPSKEKYLKNFRTIKTEQSEIQIPIFASGTVKKLTNFKIKGDFTDKDIIDLIVKVEPNKNILLKVFRRSTENLNKKPEKVFSKHFMPFSSVILSQYRREVKDLERDLFKFLSDGLDASDYRVNRIIFKIANLHSKHNNFNESLNIFLDYAPNEYSTICYHASKAKNDKIRRKYSKLAYELKGDGVSTFNYATEFPIGSIEYEKLIKEAVEKGSSSAKYSYGFILIKSGQKEEGDSLIKEVYEKLLSLFRDEPKGLRNFDYDRIKTIANHYNDDEIIEEIEFVEKLLEEERMKMRSEANKENFLSRN